MTKQIKELTTRTLLVLIIIMLSVLIFGCSDDSPQSANDTQQEEQNRAPKDAEKATISRVVDGDTIEVSYNGSTEDVRLLLVDTPETVHPSKLVQLFGPEASKFAEDILTPGEGSRLNLWTQKG